jgi:hypothetical protein
MSFSSQCYRFQLGRAVFPFCVWEAPEQPESNINPEYGIQKGLYLCRSGLYVRHNPIKILYTVCRQTRHAKQRFVALFDQSLILHIFKDFSSLYSPAVLEERKIQCNSRSRSKANENHRDQFPPSMLIPRMSRNQWAGRKSALRRPKPGHSDCRLVSVSRKCACQQTVVHNLCATVLCLLD